MLLSLRSGGQTREIKTPAAWVPSEGEGILLPASPSSQGLAGELWPSLICGTLTLLSAFPVTGYSVSLDFFLVLNSISFAFLCVCLACMYIRVPCVSLVPTEARREY